MKIELELNSHYPESLEVRHDAVCLEVTPEINDWLRGLIRKYGDVRITAITLLPSDTELYIHRKL